MATSSQPQSSLRQHSPALTLAPLPHALRLWMAVPATTITAGSYQRYFQVTKSSPILLGCPPHCHSCLVRLCPAPGEAQRPQGRPRAGLVQPASCAGRSPAVVSPGSVVRTTSGSSTALHSPELPRSAATAHSLHSETGRGAFTLLQWRGEVQHERYIHHQGCALGWGTVPENWLKTNHRTASCV